MKLTCKDIFVYAEVIKAFMKAKENGEILNAWLRNCRSILDFMKKEIQNAKRERERERKENTWRAAEQFLLVFP